MLQLNFYAILDHFHDYFFCLVHFCVPKGLLPLRFLSLFVCVEVVQPSQPNGVKWSMVSLPNHTFTGQA